VADFSKVPELVEFFNQIRHLPGAYRVAPARLLDADFPPITPDD
jgi:hypothetical protein